MIEVAIVAMEEALRADGAEVPAGSLAIDRFPMPEPGETAAGVRAATEELSADPGTTSRTVEADAIAPVSDPPLPG